MTQTLNIYSLGSHNHRPFEGFGIQHIIYGPEGLEVNEAPSILILHGGEDISPSLYGHEKHPKGGGSVEPSLRDAREFATIKKAVELGIPIFGICRGAQMLCAAAGGTLFQHVDNHSSGDHLMKTYTGRVFTVNSMHHQMMNPFALPKEDYEMIGWSYTKQSKEYHAATGTVEEIEKEPEAIWFPKIGGFAIQGHPEFQLMTSDFSIWCRSEFFKRTLA